MKISNWLSAAAAANPDRVALVDGDRRISYAELDHEASITARRLRALGVTSGARVATTLPAGAELVVLLHAAIRAGAALAPLDPNLPESKRAALLEPLAPALVIDDARQLSGAAEEADRGSPDEIDFDQALCVIHTSGSGGVPKPVTLTCANHLWSAVGSGMRIGMRPDDRWLCCLPMHHIGGLAIPIRCAIYGATAIIEPFEPAVTAATIGEATIVSVVATMLDRLLDHGIESRALRCALLGGGPAPASLIERAIEAGVPLAPTYGMTEACSQVTTLTPDELRRRPESAGRPIPGTKLTIDGDGRIVVSGPTVAPAERDGAGRLRTGDLGRLDEDGYLYVLGRADEVIITGGENVSPEEVEQVIVGHPAVTDAAVFSRDDPQWQSAVVAAVVSREGSTVDVEQLRAYCRDRLPGYKVPKSFELVESLPRNSQGKLMRKQLG